MIPLMLVTGFLGSGKTTLLRRIVERNRARRFVYLINEFSPTDIDGQVLEVDADCLVSIAGGSIFCRCLVTEFIGQLTRISTGAADVGSPIEGVVVETSGIADPRVVGRMLRETRLDREYTLGTIACVVDPGSFLELIEVLPNIRAQIEAGTIALVNKADLYPEPLLRETEQVLLRINPSIRVARTQHCRTELDVFAVDTARPRLDEAGDYAVCTDPNYAIVTITPPECVDLDRLISELRGWDGEVYRVKGFVRVAGGEYRYIDLSAGGITTQPVAKPPARVELVCIVPSKARERIVALREAIMSSAAVAGKRPNSESIRH